MGKIRNHNEKNVIYSFLVDEGLNYLLALPENIEESEENAQKGKVVYEQFKKALK